MSQSQKYTNSTTCWPGALVWAATLVALPSVSLANGNAAYVESASDLGVEFHHFNGMVGKLYFAEHMGPGVGLLDYDQDGDLDLFVGQGTTFQGDKIEDVVYAEPQHELPLSDRLYRNDLVETGTLAFTDVTAQSGLAKLTLLYNMAVGVGDVDSNGYPDLYLGNHGSNQLLLNQGDGTFQDVTEAWGADDVRWSVALTFFDYDVDGDLDLFVGNYVEFRAALHKNCASPQGAFDYCGPLAYHPEPNRLLRNDGGKFTDTTSSAGISGLEESSTLGAVADDFNGDGTIDLYVANDMRANRMWINQGDGRFVDEAELSGAAVDIHGNTQASMGVVAQDLTGDGLVDLFMTHLKRETNTLYVNEGDGFFADNTTGSGLDRASIDFTGFGTAVIDYNQDDIPDLYVVNGAVSRLPELQKADDPHPLRQGNQLFRGLGGGRFELVPEAQRVEPQHTEVSRGLAVGDLDNDGDEDLVISNNAERLRILLRRGEPSRSWAGVRVVERLSEDAKKKGLVTDALGAQVRLTAPKAGAWQRVRTDGSFASARDPRRIFYFDGATAKPVAEVRWTDGKIEQFDLAPGSFVELTKGAGRSTAGG